uniref:Cystatin domain-containing protein n=1 Tax=Glossina brevipalpis TaxID=37001 RepID=A0A1A9WNF5_9MUSC
MFNFKLLLTVALAFISIMMVHAEEDNQLKSNEFVVEVEKPIKAGNEPCVGCPHQLEGEDLRDAQNTLQRSLKKLAEGDGPVYQLIKLNSATSQVVSGILYKIEAVLGDGSDTIKECDIEIWLQPWLVNDAVQVTFKCPNQKPVIKTHNF